MRLGQTDRQTDRQTYRQTDTHMDRQTDRQADRQTDYSLPGLSGLGNMLRNVLDFENTIAINSLHFIVIAVIYENILPLTDRQTNRQTDRQTHGQTGKQIDRQTDRQTDERVCRWRTENMTNSHACKYPPNYTDIACYKFANTSSFNCYVIERKLNNHYNSQQVLWLISINLWYCIERVHLSIHRLIFKECIYSTKPDYQYV